MAFPAHKTKLIGTIGPASDSPQILKAMILAGMNVARLNFSHGDFPSHKEAIDKIKAASLATERRVAIMADLPGPKIRIGQIDDEPIELKPGDSFTLTTEEIIGDAARVSVSFSELPRTVKSGDKLYINDGYVQVEVNKIDGNDVHCKVLTGGRLRSRKGLNLPGIDLGISAFTDHDRACLKFAMENGVDAVSQSFVQTGQDIEAVRQAASELGHDPFIIAKIERAGARRNLSDILQTADGIMIARGDLGVEIPIEQIAVAQKDIIRQANMMGKPVITATQMLESMTTNRRPTRAEATDVANAILDGTDSVMLSGESAMGLYPVDAVAMLAKIAAVIEPHRSLNPIGQTLRVQREEDKIKLADLIAQSVETTLTRITPPTVIVPTRSGATARSISRSKLPVWITAVSSQEQTCQDLMFSYGVHPVHAPDHPENWRLWAKNWLHTQGIRGDLVVLTEGPSTKHPARNNRMEIIDLRRE
ncbi:MAG: pyruvate kinase [Desulfobacterales bacterium]|nr:pyruvate kinase [Deltaproteobacteria bacterium]NNL75524.1 pyruvate kinase [Desulfobacterales bacterium]